MSQQSVLSIAGLSKSYAGRVAVDDLSFDVQKGEFFTLLGPSGCGKSTTLMAVAGFVKPDAGQILLRGHDITSSPPEKRGLGVVFQSYALFPHLSVVENVMFPLRMRGMSRAAARQEAAQALDLVQLAVPDARPANLSGGQRQRVALARALVFHPDVLLMDEPLGALDRRLRQELQFEFRRLQTQIDATVVWVTHDQEEALALSDRVAIMRAGRFEQVGSAREIYRAPRSVFAARFLGESNTVPVAVRERDGQMARVEVDTGGGRRAFDVPDNPDVEGATVLVVRPEDVRVDVETAVDTSSNDSCCFKAELLDAVFLGEAVRVEARDLAGRRWIASLPGRTHDPVLVTAAGATVCLSWRTSDAHLVLADVEN